MNKMTAKSVRLPFGIELHFGHPINPGELRFEHSAHWHRTINGFGWSQRCTRNRYRITKWFGLTKLGWGFVGVMRFGPVTYETATSFDLHDAPNHPEDIPAPPRDLSQGGQHG